MPSCCRRPARATTCSRTSATAAACSARPSRPSARSVSTYNRTMSRWFLVCLVVGCGSSKPEPVPPKKPNNELVVGDFERRKPSGEQAFRFDNNGNYFVVKNKGELDHTPHIS